MKRIVWMGGGTVAVVAMIALGAIAIAQPPERPEGHRPDPLRGALDTNHDHVLDADEIKNASSAILSLDADGDGALSDEEFQPPRPSMPPMMRGGRGPRGGQDGGERGLEGGPPRRGQRNADGSDGPRAGPPRNPPVEGRTPRESREGGGGPGSREDRDGQGGPPSTERFIERAMSFDTDQDGKLDRSELLKLAQEMERRRGGQGGGPEQ